MSYIIAHIGDQQITSHETARAATPGALYAQLEYISNIMRSAGFPYSIVLTYAIAQAMHESNWFTSHVFQTDNNATGIKFISKPYQHATKGLPVPKSEGGGNYAHFATVADWAKDFLRILSLNTGGQGRPIDAATAQQYLDRLKANHYFTDTGYYGKFNAVLKKVADALKWGADQGAQFKKQYDQGERTFTHDAEKGLVSNEGFNFDRKLKLMQQWATDHPVLATAAGGVFVILVVKAISK